MTESKLHTGVDTAYDEWSAEDIGKTIAILRKVQKISQKELAEKCSVSHVFISSIERGQKKPSKELKTKIVKALDITDEVFYANVYLYSSIPKSHLSGFSKKQIDSAG
jgi:transcriptional regulator with XRE-family HTH domain